MNPSPPAQDFRLLCIMGVRRSAKTLFRALGAIGIQLIAIEVGA